MTEKREENRLVDIDSITDQLFFAPVTVKFIAFCSFAVVVQSIEDTFLWALFRRERKGHLKNAWGIVAIPDQKFVSNLSPPLYQ